MNKSEKKGFNWLLTQGIPEVDITFQRNRTPDFVLKDGRSFEVKHLYKGKYTKKIIFSTVQLKWLIEATNAKILVFSDGNTQPVAIIPVEKIRKKRVWKGIKLHGWGEGRRGKISVTLREDLVHWVNQKVRERVYSTSSHAVEVALLELRKMETSRAVRRL